MHCVQGISRSATIVLAYKIFSEKCTYENAVAHVKDRRGCVNPNLTFILQLRQFYTRLYENFEALQMTPRVFLVCSYEIEDPMFVAPRLIIERLYEQGNRGSARQGKVLDPRALFLVIVKDRAWLWQGAKVHPFN